MGGGRAVAQERAVFSRSRRASWLSEELTTDTIDFELRYKVLAENFSRYVEMTEAELARRGE